MLAVSSSLFEGLPLSNSNYRGFGLVCQAKITLVC